MMKKLIILNLFWVVLTGCAERWDLTSKGKIKYFVLKINSENHVIRKGDTDAVVRERFFYGLPPLRKLSSFGADGKSAIKGFIDYRGAAPVECDKGYKVYDYGSDEGGGGWAVLECEQHPQESLSFPAGSGVRK